MRRPDRRRDAGARDAIIAAALGRASAGAAAWAGSLIGARGRRPRGRRRRDGLPGGRPAGARLVVGSATFMAIQPSLLAGRDPAAVTAVQFAGAALAALAFAAVFEGPPAAPTAAGPVVAVAGLALAGTLVAFWLFAWGQAQVPAELASTFVNLEPLVGALTGVVAFQDASGPHRRSAAWRSSPESRCPRYSGTSHVARRHRRLEERGLCSGVLGSRSEPPDSLGRRGPS